ncbi:hypothetical protein ABIB80_007217 [Bradyrhizobium sp. i1.15.2]|uniref:hypothetical protein n=1 Tax=Bradyrhizobium sp. i1.15.2 TaxID=3156362 RepID=UPI003390BC06
MIEIVGGTLIALGIVVLLVIGSRSPKRDSALKIKQSQRAQPPPTASALEDLIWHHENDLPPPEDYTAPERERKQQQAQAAVEKRRKWLRPFGVFGRLATYAVAFLLLYAYWPADISHKPFASLTLSDLLGTAAAVAIGFGLIRALFEPSDEEDIKDAWGWVGVAIVGLAVVAMFYFSSQR